MNVTEATNYREAVIASAPEWVQGKSTISNAGELITIADHYNVSVPKYTQHFLYSENPNHLVATGAWKGLSNFLTRLANKIQAKESNTD